jgi:uncharacterized Zn-finger protein
MAKVMNHRIEKLSTLLDLKEIQLNEISIERQNQTNEVSDNNSCSSPIKVEPLLIVQKSKRFKINSSNRKLKCETCKKRFPSQSKLNIHNRIHSKEKPFACDQCQMTFTQKSNLTTHKRTHSEEKPYQCNFCPKKFAQFINLISHKRLHTGEKPYRCGSCQMKFSNHASLTYHKRIHS